MTLPDERYRSLVQTKKFLMELQSPHILPKIPKAVRQRANSLLKHWPDDYHLESICEALPNSFAKEIEPLYGMVKRYERSKE